MLPTIRKRSYGPHYADHFFGKDLFTGLFSDGADYSVPAVNIKETDKAYEIEMAIPGLGKDDINLKLENNILTISSSQNEEKEEKNGNYTKREFSYKAFSRSFSVPEEVNSDKIKASHKNGVLQVELPKMEKSEGQKSKSIKIS